MTVYKIRRKTDRLYKVQAGSNKDYDERGNSYSSWYSANAAVLSSARTVPHPNKEKFIKNHELVEFKLTEKEVKEVDTSRSQEFIAPHRSNAAPQSPG